MADITERIVIPEVPRVLDGQELYVYIPKAAIFDLNIEKGTGDVLVQTIDTDHSFKVMTDGRAKVQSAPVDDNDVVRKIELDTKLDKGPIPSEYLPSYVDNVVEYDSKNDFPKPGEEGKIYVDKSTNLTYRWSGSTYIMIGGRDLNLENGTGTGSLVQKRLSSDGVTWKTAKAYQGASVALGGGTQAGRTEEQFYNYFWDNTTNTPINGGQGKTSEGEVKDNRGLTYSKSYSYGVAEGETTKALGRGSHSEGSGTQAIGEYSHTEGYISQSVGDASHSEGWNAKANGRASHSEGEETRAEAVGSHAEGNMTKAKAPYSHAEGVETESQGTAAHSEGQNTKSIGNNSHAEGDTTTANGLASHSEGRQTKTGGNYSHVEGYKAEVRNFAYTAPTGSGSGSGVTGGDDEQLDFDAEEHRGEGSHAEGILTISSGYSSHAEGAKTVADGMYSHAEGLRTYAKGNQSHAEGYETSATANFSHSEGSYTISQHDNSHTEGYHTKSSRAFQHVEGKFNADNPNALHIVGNGTSDTDAGRKNAFEVLDDGRAKVQSAPVDDNDVVRKKELSKLYKHSIMIRFPNGSEVMYIYVIGLLPHNTKINTIALLVENSPLLADIANVKYVGLKNDGGGVFTGVQYVGELSTYMLTYNFGATVGSLSLAGFTSMTDTVTEL